VEDAGENKAAGLIKQKCIRSKITLKTKKLPAQRCRTLSHQDGNKQRRGTYRAATFSTSFSPAPLRFSARLFCPRASLPPLFITQRNLLDVTAADKLGASCRLW